MNAQGIWKLVPLVAVLAAGLANAAEPPKVMFISGLEVQPVIIDRQGKELPAKKGMVIPPGYSVKVPEGATMQIMTPDQAIVAVRQDSLLKLESLGEGNEPTKLKLDNGGIRVANSEKKPRKFEVDTPNAKIRFDKGDHEAYFLKQGKLKDGRWGTIVRAHKDNPTLSTKDGEYVVTRRDYGYVPGDGKGKTELLARIDVGGKGFTDPVSLTPGSNPENLRDMMNNQDKLAKGGEDGKPVDPVAPRGLPPAPPLTEIRISKSLPKEPPVILEKRPLPTLAKLPEDIRQPKTLDKALPPEIIIGKTVDGKPLPVVVDKKGEFTIVDTPVLPEKKAKLDQVKLQEALKEKGATLPKTRATAVR